LPLSASATPRCPWANMNASSRAGFVFSLGRRRISAIRIARRGLLTTRFSRTLGFACAH